MRVAAYTGGVMVPSARARVRQYIGPLDQLGIAVREYPLPWGNILPRPFALRPLWIAATAVSRTATLTCSWKADVRNRRHLPTVEFARTRQSSRRIPGNYFRSRQQRTMGPLSPRDGNGASAR